MNKLVKIIVVIVFFALLWSGIFADAVAFFAWLLMLNYSSPNVSVVGEIVVRILTFAVSFSLVGAFFNCRNEKIMSVTYYIVSSLLGFVFAWIVWKIEQNLLIVGIVLGIILFLVIVLLVAQYIVNKKNRSEEMNSDKDDK